MLRRRIRLSLLLVGLLLIPACGPEVLVIGGIVGSGAGTYYYIDGELVTDYSAPFDRVWNACEKTVADMRGKDVRPKREIGIGSIKTAINDETVTFKVSYKQKNLTTVGVRVGFFGNKLSSQLLHDKIYENVARSDASPQY